MDGGMGRSGHGCTAYNTQCDIILTNKIPVSFELLFHVDTTTKLQKCRLPNRSHQHQRSLFGSILSPATISAKYIIMRSSSLVIAVSDGCGILLELYCVYMI